MDENEPTTMEQAGAEKSSVSPAEEAQAPPAIAYPSGFKQAIIVLGLLLSAFLTALDISIISTAIPEITSEFNSLADVGWYGSAFFLTLAAFQSIWGKTYKYFSMRATFLTSIFIFEVGSLLCALAPNSAALIVGRAIQGAGGSGSTLGSYAIASFIAPPEKVPAIIGLIGSVFSIASVVGPLLGGVFTTQITWRWCFYINLPIGGAAFACVLLFFRTPAAAKAPKAPWREILLSLDPLGFVLLVGSLLCYFLCLQWAGVTLAWSSSTVIGLLVGWILLSVCYGVNEWKQGERALVVLRLLRIRGIGGVCAFILFLYGAYFALLYNVPIYFQAINGLSAQDSGIRTIPVILSTSLASFISSIVIGKVGKFQPFLIVGSALTAIGAGLIYMFDLDTGLGPVIGFQIIFGVGVGIVVQLPVIVAGALSAVADRSIALSTVCVTQFFSASLVIAASDSIMNNLLLKNLPIYAPKADPQKVLLIGASGIQNVFDGDTLRGIRQSFVIGLRGAWALGIAFFCVAFLCTFIQKWPGNMAPEGKGEAKEEVHSSGSSDKADPATEV